MARRLVLFALLLVALAGCGQAAPDLPLYRAIAEAPAPTTTTTAPAQVAADSYSHPDAWTVADPNVQLDGPPYHIAAVTVPRIGIYDSPTAAAPRMVMSNKTEHGLDRVFLVAGQDNGRLKVLLPIRPNESVGWVQPSDVNIQELNYWIKVSTSGHSITVGNATQLLMQAPAAVGTGGTPTPLGLFYLTEVVRPVWQPYLGPYAFATSAHSNVLTSFMGGDGMVGLHGTDAPGSIGRAVSHGCIRIGNADITKLAMMLPLGTPLIVGP
ncbi:MAG: L,D-transpeptidase [Acidimicrobiia bacterium]|nr:L,D-transpeptidase [Acidimicrobiia bacterium]